MIRISWMKWGGRVKRLLRLALLFIILLELSSLFVQAVGFSVRTEGACRPGKTVALTVFVDDPGDTAAFLVTAESDALAFVRADASAGAKVGYTRAYGAGSSGSFVYTAKGGAADFSGEAVTFVFRAPETPGNYAVTVTVSQVANAAGEMTDTFYTETLTIAVEVKAPDTPPAEAYSSMPEESEDETASSNSGEEASTSTGELPVASTAPTPAPTAKPLEPLPAGGQNSFLLGMGAAAMVFALGMGFYVLLARQKEPPKDE